MHDNSDWSTSLRVEVRGDDVVGHAGNVIPRMLADATGLTGALSAAVSRPEVTHDRGAVWRDVAVAIAGGAENLAGSAVLRDQARLFGPVLVTREFASFTVGWLTCQVTPDALQLTTVVPEEFERVRDAAVGILNTLSH